MVHIDNWSLKLLVHPYHVVGLCGESYVVQYTSQHTKSANITDRISKISFSLHLQVVVVKLENNCIKQWKHIYWMSGYGVFLQLMRIRAFLHSFSFSMLPATGMLIALSKNKPHWKKLGLQKCSHQEIWVCKLVHTIQDWSKQFCRNNYY